jgi:hypothetical protein
MTMRPKSKKKAFSQTEKYKDEQVNIHDHAHTFFLTKELGESTHNSFPKDKTVNQAFYLEVENIGRRRHDLWRRDGCCIKTAHPLTLRYR